MRDWHLPVSKGDIPGKSTHPGSGRELMSLKASKDEVSSSSRINSKGAGLQEFKIENRSGTGRDGNMRFKYEITTTLNPNPTCFV